MTSSADQGCVRLADQQICWPCWRSVHDEAELEALQAVVDQALG
jgi:hypothetical protein